MEQNAEKIQVKKSVRMVFLQIFFTIFLLFLISFLKTRFLLRQVSGGILFARLEQSVLLTNFVLCLCGFLIGFFFMKRFLKNIDSSR